MIKYNSSSIYLFLLHRQLPIITYIMDLLWYWHWMQIWPETWNKCELVRWTSKPYTLAINSKRFPSEYSLTSAFICQCHSVISSTSKVSTVYRATLAYLHQAMPSHANWIKYHIKFPLQHNCYSKFLII